MWFFESGFLKPEDEAWHFETWAWMLRSFGGMARLKKAPLVTPTPEFFPPTTKQGDRRAEYVLACVKKHMEMSSLPVRLVAQPDCYPEQLNEAFGQTIAVGMHARSTYQDGELVITYNPTLQDWPLILVFTFAHELADYLLTKVSEPPPDDSEMHEYAADMVTVFFGLGIFGADSAFTFWKEAVGTKGTFWTSSTEGYLREADWVYALAVFLTLRAEDPATLQNWLKASLYSDFKKAYHSLAKKQTQLLVLQQIH